MDSLTSLLCPGGKLFGIEWHTWKIIGWLGNFVFFSRFIVLMVRNWKTKTGCRPSCILVA